MSVAVSPVVTPTVAPRPARRRADLVTAAVSLTLAVWVTAGLWRSPNGRVIEVNSGDQALFEWLLALGGHTLRYGQDPLFTHLLNVPDGVNLAVNTSITVFAWVFAPLTWLIGAPATFLVILTLNLAGSAWAWYWLISRNLDCSGLAAGLGGLFCGFAPGLVSHANAHLNWTAQWLSVLVIWAVLRLRGWRSGVLLGVLIAVSFSIAAEALFFTALACGVFLGVWAWSRRPPVAAFLRGLGVAFVVASALLAYPLWMHFLGPRRYHGIGFDQRIHSEDLAAYGAVPARSLAGLLGLDGRLAPNPTEETTFFGPVLLVLVVVCFVLLWRSLPARRILLRALGVTALVFVVLSLGPRLKLFGDITPVPLPYALLAPLPIFNAALPARFALAVAPVIGILLALTVDLARAFAPARRGALTAALALALVPLLPVPLLTVPRAPVPDFFAAGGWRAHVPEGGVIVPVPLPSDLLPDGQRWQARALADRDGVFAVPGGFFLGPGGPDGRGRIGPVPRPTETLLFDAAKTGVVPTVTEADRDRARDDLRYWRASVIVLADGVFGAKWPVHYEAVRETATALFGPPRRVGDVWLWTVQP